MLSHIQGNNPHGLTDLEFCGADTQHMFTMKENDWGFNQFMTQRQLTSPAEGFILNDTVIIEVHIRLERFESYFYNSKKETGHVGLKNQGATCYMNSLLQTLYNLNHFRKARLFSATITDHLLVLKLSILHLLPCIVRGVDKRAAPLPWLHALRAFRVSMDAQDP